MFPAINKGLPPPPPSSSLLLGRSRSKVECRCCLAAAVKSTLLLLLPHTALHTYIDMSVCVALLTKTHSVNSHVYSSHLIVRCVLADLSNAKG